MSRALSVAALLVHQRKRIHILEEELAKVEAHRVIVAEQAANEIARLKDQLAEADANVDRVREERDEFRGAQLRAEAEVERVWALIREHRCQEQDEYGNYYPANDMRMKQALERSESGG